MAKLFFWVVIIIAILIVTRVLAQKKIMSTRNKIPPKGFSKKTEQMVRCAHCGVHLPRSEALMSNEHTWCSLEHAKLGPRNL